MPNWILTDNDRASMPPDLLKNLEAWHHQRLVLDLALALSAESSYQEDHPRPTKVTGTDVVIAAMHAVQGLCDASYLCDHAKAWVDQGRGEQSGRNVEERLVTWMLIVEAKRLDLLEALLAVPGMLPSNEDVPKRRHEKRARVFNGSFYGLLPSFVRPFDAKGPGAVLTLQGHQLNTELRRVNSPLLHRFDFASEAVLVKQELTAVGNRQNLAAGYNMVSPIDPAYRSHVEALVGGRTSWSSTNLIGFVVLHGWAEGLRPLLDHGFRPDACYPSAASSSLPLMLASVFNEPACAKVLLDHPSFNPMQTFGDFKVAKGLWNLVGPDVAPGYDWSLLWRSPVRQHAAVLASMMQRWDGLKPVQRRKILQDPVVAREVEAVQLRAVAEAMPIATSQAVRSRPRL